MKQLLIWALIILGTRTKIWESASQEEFLQGTAAGVAIAPEGVMMGPSLKEVVQLDDPYIWAMIQDDRGQLYLGTGDEGRLYQLKDGSLSLSFDSPGSQLTAIAVDRSHNLYAGSAPDGAVYKITPKGKVKEFFSSKERYTWGLAVDDKDNIYCATGELGRLYKLSPDGSAELIFEAPALHILSLIWANGLYFGSQAGVVYRRTGNDLRVLYEAVQTEIRALGLDDSSCLWFAANPEYEGEEPARPWLYRISPDGITEPIWSPPDSFVFALSPQANSVLVATGNKGRLYRVSGSREVVLLAQVEPAQITGICGKDPVWLSTANPARVYRVEEQYARRGSLTSRPLDAAATARWGRLSWEGVVPKGSKIEFETRSGHTSEPDETWSEWQGVSDGVINSPPARFLQWRANLSASSPELSPLLRRVSVAYQEANLAPWVMRLKVAQNESLSRTQRKLSWLSWDPNQDSLVADIYFKGVEEERWKVLKLEVEGQEYILETQTLPDGRYQLKVVLSDRPDNPGKLARDFEKISAPFLVDNTPPRVKELRAKEIKRGVYRINFIAEDDLSRIESAEYSVNAGDFKGLAPADLIFDAPKEEFSFELELEPGEYTVAVRVTDELGNPGLGKLIIRR